ncbi:MAG TPA: glutamine amidotransferase [Thermoguttaceae bacterium]|nr:glutamine amidotransferase [Thermoguttaceae bacterium]
MTLPGHDPAYIYFTLPMLRLVLYPIAESYLLVAVVALVLFGLLALGPRGGGMTAGRRRTLFALRLLTVVLVVLVLLRPTVVRTETRSRSATLVVLADTSRSMSVPDARGGRKTRYEALRESLDAARDGLGELAESFEVKAYAFDADIRPVEQADGEIELPETPEGDQTALGAALADVLRFEAGKRLLGVVVLSDGAQRAYAPRDLAPQTAAIGLRRQGCPLYTVPLGQSRGLGQAKDVDVGQLLVDENVFANNEMNVAAEIRVNGLANRELPVRLLFETSPGQMEVVAQEVIKPSVDGQMMPVALAYVPQTPGQYKVTVEVPEQPGELVTTNNRMSTFVNVLPGGLNVLYIEGSPPRIDTKFLRRALDASPEIDVDYLSFTQKTRPADLIERFKPGRYMVYVLGDVPARAFTRDQLAALAQAVDRGAGLAMLGGFSTFGPGGYADTPLADVLPIRMSRLEEQRPGEPIRRDVQLPGPIRMKPSRFGADHFTLMLSGEPRKNAALWERLPPLDGANRFDPAQLKPSSLVLAADQHDRPLLVVQPFGAGRAMAFAGDTTWRWAMRGFDEEHKRFWRQVILWLARKDELGEGNVWVRLAQRRLEPGGRLEVTAGANSPEGDPVADAVLDAEVTSPDGKTQPLRLTRRGEHWTGSFAETREAGDYLVTVRARTPHAPREVPENSNHIGQGETALGQARARFLVFEEDLELDNASADPGGLESLAAMTAGRSIAPEQLPELLEELGRQKEQLEEKIETKRTYWDTWPFFLALVALLSAEWFLRKRWGLV